MRVILLLSVTVSMVCGQQFWYINDIHYDPTYDTIGESCIGDVTNRDPLGDYACDAPWQMVEEAISKMANLFGTPDFIVWGGGNTFNANTTNTVYTEEMLLQIMTNITNLFKEKFPLIQVVPVLGGHDWFPKSQLPADGDPLYDKYLELWQDWIPGEYDNTFKQAGYYKINLSDEIITAIVLNTALYLEENEAVTGSDPGGQFEWLRQELTSAKETNKKVHIMMHAPIGQLDPEYDSQLTDIITEFHDVITAIYGGHQQTDEFKLIYDRNRRLVSFILLAPSLSPRIGQDGFPRNPAFRRYNFDNLNQGGRIDNSQQYYKKLDENLDFQSLYSYSHFGMVNVNATTLRNLLTEMTTYGSSRFHDYYRYKHVDIQNSGYYHPCDCNCKENEICAINNVQESQYEDCRASLTCAADKHYYSIILISALYILSKIIHL